jgi:site-specific DNA-methyltransferase (adenine-specific)
VARKPIVGTVANNVMTWGTGGVNVDGCRVGSGDDRTSGGNQGSMPQPMDWETSTGRERPTGARFPANLIHDGSDEVVGLFPQTKATGRPNCIGKIYNGVNNGSSEIYNDGYQSRESTLCYSDSGSNARFFYCAKASKADRGDANHHPTVKPTDLMRYLCRLVTPPNGTVLDPFMGSGSTGKAAILEGFRFIGIEREAEYLEIARARIDHVTKEPNLWQS